MQKDFVLKDFIVITFIVSLWVHVSEIFRYFMVVQPELQTYLSVIPNVVDMNVSIFFIWGIWDTLLASLFVFLFWLCANAFGNNYKSIMLSSLVSWSFFFVLFWVGMANMSLSNWNFLPLVLLLALVESIVASVIASKLYLFKTDK